MANKIWMCYQFFNMLTMHLIIFMKKFLSSSSNKTCTLEEQVCQEAWIIPASVPISEYFWRFQKSTLYIVFSIRIHSFVCWLFWIAPLCIYWMYKSYIDAFCKVWLSINFIHFYFHSLSSCANHESSVWDNANEDIGHLHQSISGALESSVITMNKRIADLASSILMKLLTWKCFMFNEWQSPRLNLTPPSLISAHRLRLSNLRWKI